MVLVYTNDLNTNRGVGGHRINKASFNMTIRRYSPRVLISSVSIKAFFKAT